MRASTIITTHESADFDALASSVAALRLYPDALIVLGKRVGRSLKRFLALHRDHFVVHRSSDIDFDVVERLVLTDVRRRSRLAHVAPLLERRGELDVSIWDHHPAADDDVCGDSECVEPVGAVTTLLMERLKRDELRVDPIEATLFALGIHADTGSLGYAGSTSRDAAALAWLMCQGADLEVISRYLRPPMSEAQRSALNQLLGSARVIEVEGRAVAIAVAEVGKVDGLAQVVANAAAMRPEAAFFAIFPKKRRSQLIARSRSAGVHVGRVLMRLGGGGHAGAASAVSSSAELEAELEAAIHDVATGARVVRDLMSSPVRTVAPDLPFAELEVSLREWAHTGVPVLRDCKLVGMVSRRDVARAAAGGRLDLPIASAMSQDVVTIEASAPLEDALRVMTERDVGRLPVFDGERLVGIVTRSDALRVLYHGADA